VGRPWCGHGKAMALMGARARLARGAKGGAHRPPLRDARDGGGSRGRTAVEGALVRREIV
jgi:hypothetical protein